MTSAVLLLVNFNAIIFLVVTMFQRHTTATVDLPVFWHSLGFTLLQAILSSLACVVVGACAAPGYARFGKWRRVLRWILLLPGFMSPILAVLALLLTFTNFPFGMTGIIVGHLFLNCGLCTVWLGERWVEIEERWGPVNQVLGGGTWIFLARGIIPQMKTQLINTFAVVFSLCLSSFAVPLVLGGGPQNSTLEVLIYERIYSDADVAGAVVLSLVQCALQFAVFIVLLKPILLKTESSRNKWTPARFSPSLLPTLLLVGFCLAPLVRLLSIALSQPSTWEIFTADDFLTAVKTSVFTSMMVTICCFSLLCWVTTLGWRPRIMSLPALSGVAVGLAGFLLFKTWHLHNVGIFALTLVWGHVGVIFLPVFRLSSPPLESLRLKFDRVLQQLGAGPWLAFKKVYSRLGMKTFVAGGVLAGCWSMGEFSVSSMMSPSAATLPVFIHALLSSYRLEAAAGASVILLFLSVVTMSLFEVLAHGVG